MLLGGTLLQLGGCISGLAPSALAIAEQAVLSVLFSRLPLS